jgi:CYTH domain-containing protein
MPMLSTICQDDILEKERFFVEDAGGMWHIDVYSGRPIAPPFPGLWV